MRLSKRPFILSGGVKRITKKCKYKKERFEGDRYECY